MAPRPRSRKRFGSALLAAGALAIASPASAGAVLVGNPDMDYSTADFGVGCSSPGPTCLYVQTKLPGATVRAPFSGTITKWSVAVPGDYPAQLVIERKAKHGKYEPVTATDFEPIAAAGSYTFDTHVKIRQGDYIAIHTASLLGRDNLGADYFATNRPPVFGQPKKPLYKASGDEFLYNAKVKRRRH